jgi:RHS repeat-associated protein
LTTAFNRLTSENTVGGASLTHNYDNAGNPTLLRNQNPTGGAGYNTDNQNRAAIFAYDGNGNPTSYPLNGLASNLTFDEEDRLTSLGNLTFGWSSAGLRAWKQVGGGNRTYYLYEGGQPLCELDGSGNLLAVNTWGASGLASRHTASGDLFYAFDERGSVAQTINSSGQVLNSFSFDAYGAPTSAAATDPYSGYGGAWGYYTDLETGLTLCGHRFYDASQARFINRDPIGQAGGANLYQYVGGSPLMGADPLGLYSTGSYLGDVGQVLHGYGVALNPLNWIRGGVSLVVVAQTQGLGRAASAFGTGMASMLTAWMSTDDPCAFGQSFGGTLATIGLGMAGSADGLGIGAASAEGGVVSGEAGAADVASISPCFVAGTLVSMSDGATKPIEEIKVGDRALSRPVGAVDVDKTECKKVTRTFKHNVMESVAQTRDLKFSVTLSAPKPREETTLALDLSQGGDTFDETLIVPADEMAALPNGLARQARELKPGNRIYMSGSLIALVKTVETKWYTPPPPQEPDQNGNVVSRVIGATKRLTHRILYLHADGETICTTPEHPFSIEGKGWVEAGRLQQGDRIKTEGGKTVTVESLEVKAERRLVYNLRVEGTENYFVGKNRLLVHNGGDCVPTLSEAKKLFGLWDKSTFDTLADSLRYHFNEHGEELGAKNVWQFMRKAEGFKQNLRGAGRAALDGGKTRYMKNGKYIILDGNGNIVSFGLQR